jgi:hypothetical protein
MTRSTEPHATVVLVQPNNWTSRYENSIEVYLHNDGEINIKEFKLVFLALDGIYALEDYDDYIQALECSSPVAFTFRDGWPHQEGYIVNPLHPITEIEEAKQETLMVNVYPKDHFFVSNLDFTYDNNYGKYNSDLILHWMLYLPNTHPIGGKTNFNSAVQRNEI